MGGEIVLLDQEHARPADRGVAGDRRAVDSAPDDEQVEIVHGFPYRHCERSEAIQHGACRVDCFVATLLAMTDGTILVIDEGTTSTRAMLFGADGACLAAEQREIAQHYPRPGWVEHDAEEIWASSLACARAAVDSAGGAGRIAALGITNQRETIVFWSRASGRALAPAIVWQDRRTAEICARLKDKGHEETVRARTGLLLDPYFSASKIAWALGHWPQLEEAGEDLCVGTVESWLVFKLTGGLHVSDATNASRTALMDIGTGRWDDELLGLWGVPAAALPEIQRK